VFMSSMDAMQHHKIERLSDKCAQYEIPLKCSRIRRGPDPNPSED
jgi:hypothetical protein